MNPSPAPIDQAKLEELIDLFGDREEVRDLFDEYFSELPSRIEALRTGIATSTTEMVNHAAHALKGSSASLGAIQVTETARIIEESARANSLEGTGTAVDRLETELALLRAWLQSEGLLGN
jgi:HPt (histidine-containing phosphotransfer) domain-containing protein